MHISHIDDPNVLLLDKVAHGLSRRRTEPQAADDDLVIDLPRDNDLVVKLEQQAKLSQLAQNC